MNQAWIEFLPPFLRSKLDGRHTLQKILTNSGWLLGDRFLRMGIGLFVSIALVRYLAPEQFGQLNYALALSSLFSIISALGLDTIVIREIVRQPEQKNNILGTAFTLKLISSLVIWLVTIGVAIVLRPQDSFMHWLVGITAAGMLVHAFDTIDFWFQSQTQAKFIIYARGVAFLIVTLIKITFLQLHFPLVAFAWAGLAETVISAIGLLIVYKISDGRLSAWRNSFFWAKKLLKDSLPLVLSGVVMIVYMRVDQIILSQQKGDSEAGLYSAAVRLAEVWYFIPMAIVSSVFPSTIENQQANETLFYEKLQKLYQFMVLLAYSTAIPISFFSEWIIQTLYGDAYQGSIPMLAVLAWSSLFINLGIARNIFLTTLNWMKLYFMTVFLGCLLNISLNYLLIPQYGGMGAAIATLIAYWFAIHGACFFYKPLIKTGQMMTKAIFLQGFFS